MTSPITPVEKLLSTDEAAELLGVQPETIRNMARRRELAIVKIAPRKFRVSPSALRSYIAAKEAR